MIYLHLIPQEAFSHLLGEQDELIQDLASQGMSLVYELGDDAMKKSLVHALVGTLTGSGKRKRAVKVNILCIYVLLLLVVAGLHIDDFRLYLVLAATGSWWRILKYFKKAPLVKVPLGENLPHTRSFATWRMRWASPT